MFVPIAWRTSFDKFMAEEGGAKFYNNTLHMLSFGASN